MEISCLWDKSAISTTILEIYTCVVWQDKTGLVLFYGFWISFKIISKQRTVQVQYIFKTAQERLSPDECRSVRVDPLCAFKSSMHQFLSRKDLVSHCLGNNDKGVSCGYLVPVRRCCNKTSHACGLDGSVLGSQLEIRRLSGFGLFALLCCSVGRAAQLWPDWKQYARITHSQHFT